MSQPEADQSGPRLPLLDRPTDPAAIEMFDSILSRTGRLLNLHRMLGHAPAMMKASAETALALRHGTMLPRSLMELVILRIAQLLHSDYEWQQHEGMALACGVAPEKMRALEQWKASPLFSDAERAALAFTESTVAGTEPVEFARLQEQFSPREIVELTMLICHYVATARFIQALGVPLEQGGASPIVTGAASI